MRIDDLEVNILSDTGDMDLAANIGEFLRCAIEDGFIIEDQIESLVIIKESKE